MRHVIPSCLFQDSKDAGPEYDLYAVINHSGTMAAGHYVATCRVPGAPKP